MQHINRNENKSVNGIGGAVRSNPSSIVYLVYSNFFGNTAETDGGALYVEGSLNIMSSTLQDNKILLGRGKEVFVTESSSTLI